MSDATLLTEARSELERHLPYTVPPALDSTDLDALLVQAKECSTWAASTVYEYGAIVRPSDRNGRRYINSVAGTSDDTEPDWVVNASIADGTDIVWFPYGPDPRQIYNVRKAIHQGWLMKATKASALVSTQTPEGRIEHQQVYEHCLAMAQKYAPVEFG